MEQSLKLSEQVFDFACKVQERFTQGDSNTKKQILATMSSNLTLKDKKLLIEAKKPFFILENTLFPEKPILSPIEPEITEVPQGQNIPSIFMSLSMRGGRDDVRTLRNKSRKLARRIYRFFKTVCASPEFKLSDWFLLSHGGSMDDWKN